MKKRLGSILLTLAMLLALAPPLGGSVRALAGPVTWTDESGNPHQLTYGTDGGYTTATIDGELKAKFATALTQDNLSTNYQRGLANSTYCFYLAENVELPYGLVIYAGTIWLDLNGHTITYNGTTNGTSIYPVGVITIFTGATLNLVDSKGTGGITRTAGDKIDGILINSTSETSTYFNMYGGAIFGNHRGVNNRDSNGTFNLYGGTIKNNVTTTQWDGGGVYNGGSFTMYSGTIDGNTADGSGGGVYNGGSFTMHDGTISNNTSSRSVSYYGGGGVFNKEECQFTMNGGTIENNSAHESGGGVCNRGVFTMGSGATVSRNTSGSRGGGVFNYKNNTYTDSGSFTMNGGTISLNTTSSYGGAVHVNANSTFTMNSGTISLNTGEYGGVYVDAYSTFSMSGGTISQNTSRYNGGIQVNGAFSLSGNPTISGNVKGGTISDGVLTGGTANNVYLYSNKYITVGNPLSPTTPIGVTMSSAGVFTNGASYGNHDAARAVFKSDDSHYTVILDGTQAKLAALYTVTWKNQDGNTVLEADSNVAAGTQPSFDGTAPTKAEDTQYTYIFAGWADSPNKESGTAVDSLPTVTSNTTYYAAFSKTAKAYTLTWALDGGEIKNGGTAAGNVAYGTTLTAPTVEKTGYTFSSWLPAIAATMPAGDTTYTAQWTPNSYTVAFDANGGTGNMSDQAFTYDTAQNLTVNGFIYDKHTFSGWNTAADGTGVSYADGAEVSNLTAEANGGVTLYAQWTDNGTVVAPTFSPAAGSYIGTQSVTLSCGTDGATIYYTTDGSEPTTGSTAYSGAISVDSSMTIKAYAVKATLHDSAVAEAAYTISAPPTPTPSPTTSPATYTVTVGNGTADKTTAAAGEAVTVTANTPAAGKVFDRWTGDASFADATSATTTFTMPARNVTVTATYKDKPKSSAALTMADYVYGATPGGYTLTDKAGTGEETAFYSTASNGGWQAWPAAKALNVGTYYLKVEIAEDAAHLAGEAITTFRVTPAQYPAPNAPVVSGYTVTVNAADREKRLEYSLDGVNYTPVPTLDNGTFKLSGLTKETNYSIYLRQRASADGNYIASPAVSTSWTTPSEWTVAYNANYGVGTVPATQTSDGTAALTVASAGGISRVGYTFQSWNTKADGTGADFAPGDTISTGATLYAQWTANRYTVRFDAAGGSGAMADQGFTYDVAHMLTANAFVREGHTFAGWAADAGGSTLYMDRQSVKNLADSGSITLYAVWTQNTYSVSGSVESPTNGTVTVKLLRGSDQFASQSITITGGSGAYTFTGVPAGIYNLVITMGDQTITEIIIVSNAGVTKNITLPSGKVNSVLEIKGEDTPAVVAGGLDREALEREESGKTVTVTMTVEKQMEVQLPETASEKEKETQEAIADIKEAATKNSTGIELEYMNIDVEKTTNDGETTEKEAVKETATLMEIVIAFDMTGKSGLRVFRQHNGTVSELTRNESAYSEGTFYWLNGWIHLFANKFSTYAISYTAGYTITFDANGGTGTMADQTISGTAALNANAFTRSGYTFNGWNTAANGSGTAYVNGASITPSADLTLFAQWKANSPGNNTTSGIGGGYYPSITMPAATDTVPVSGESSSVSVGVTVSGETATIKAPTTAELDRVIGESVRTGDIVIDLRGLSKNIAAVSIPAETIRAIEKAISDPNNDARSLTIKLTDGSVTFDAGALATIAAQMLGSDLRLHLDNVGTSALKAAQQTTIQKMDVQAVYDVYLTSNGIRISDFKGGSATVAVPYMLKDGQKDDGVVVWYVADNGDKSEVPTRYNSMEVIFTVEHFSNYVLVYDAEHATSGAQDGYAVCPKKAACPISVFGDANATEWYHDGMHWALENSVMNGMDDGLLHPNDATTRAQAATMLWRLAGSPIINEAVAFADVAEGEWYTDAIRWAAAVDVVTGFSRDGVDVFDPDAPVTREQLAAMLYRYAKRNGQGFTGAWMFPLDYPDAASVSEWAGEAMHWMVMKGVIGGTVDEHGVIVLDPQGCATRAQVATMLMRY